MVSVAVIVETCLRWKENRGGWQSSSSLYPRNVLSDCQESEIVSSLEENHGRLPGRGLQG
jgi:hypothetical protein